MPSDLIIRAAFDVFRERADDRLHVHVIIAFPIKPRQLLPREILRGGFFEDALFNEPQNNLNIQTGAKNGSVNIENSDFLHLIYDLGFKISCFSISAS